MNCLKKSFFIASLFLAFGQHPNLLCTPSANQTNDTSPIYGPNNLPFTVSIEQAGFTLPNGIHSGVSGTYHGRWLFFAGRTNGLHGFGSGPNNFNPVEQNTVVYVVDPINQTVVTKSLYDASSGLTQQQIDLLSVTSPQSYQKKQTIYMTGGYGVDTSTGLFSTKNVLTAVDIPGLMHWVINASPGETAAQHIRQIAHPLFQVTGGFMDEGLHDTTLLIFGQNFKGFYSDNSNGLYTKQVRRFKIHDDGKNLSVEFKNPKPIPQDPSFRRRDLNVVPCIFRIFGESVKSFVAFSGVFTLDTGVWTVPVSIFPDGTTSMADPTDPLTFKQGMNNYVCPTVGLFSHKHNDMYVIFLGGISYGFFQNGVFTTDSEIPFINQVTTVKMNEKGYFKQYLMENQYPVILSPPGGPNPGNQLLFGAGAFYMPVEQLPSYDNDVLKLDKLGKEPIIVGYIVGGIQSTLPNTNTQADSQASSYIFRVVLTPR